MGFKVCHSCQMPLFPEIAESALIYLYIFLILNYKTILPCNNFLIKMKVGDLSLY